MPVTDYEFIRARYLQALLSHYGTLTIPVSSREQNISLDTVFQPLSLRQRASSTAQDQWADQADGDEQQSDESQPIAIQEQPVLARDGSQALEKSPARRLLILGGPGMGKTTLLKVLLQKAIHTALDEPAASLPLFISLPDLARSGLPLTAYLPRLLAELEIETTFAEHLREAITHGQAFFCLDSLDEVLPAQRPDLIAFINRLAPQYGGTWVIGSRFTEYQDGQFSSGRFAEWELLPLDETLRRQLANHLFPLLSSLFKKPLLSTETFLHMLAHDQHITEWGNNPLLFSLAAIIYAQQEMLPTNRAALYSTVIDTILALRFADPAQRNALRKQLARLALDLYQVKGRNFTLQDLQGLLVTYGYGPKEIDGHLTHILDSGLLDVVAHQTYGFKHQMFQEYLAAMALADQLLESNERVVQATWDFVRRKSTYSRWREILRLLVGVLVQEYGGEGSRVAANWLQYLSSLHTTEEGDPGHLCLVLALISLQEFPAHEYSPQMVQAIRSLTVLWAEQFFEALLRGAGSYYAGQGWENIDITDADRIFDRLEQLIEIIQLLDLSLVLPALFALEQAFEQAKTREVVDRVERKLEGLLRDLARAIPARVLALAFPEQSKVNLSTIVTRKKLEVTMAVASLIALMEDQREQWPARVGAAPACYDD